MLGAAQEAVALCNYFAGMSKKPRLGLSGGEASSEQRCMTLLKHMEQYEKSTSFDLQ